MATNEQIIELIRFESTGLPELEARTRAYAERVEHAQAQTKALNAVLSGGRYAGYAEQVRKADGALEQMQARARGLALGVATANGEMARHMATMAEYGRAAERMNAHNRNRATAAALASGATVKHAEVMAMHTRINEQLKTRELSDTLASPKYTRETAATETQRAEQQNLRADHRNRVFASRFEAGDLTRQTLQARQLNHEFDVMRSRANARVLAKELTDGTLARRAADMASLRRESESLEKRARLTELVAEHGRYGAVLRANAGQIQTLRTAALVGYGTMTAGALGFVRAGLQGTVEGYMLERQWQRLSRQAAAIATPAVNKLADAVGGVADRFQALPGDAQDVLLNLGLAGLAAGPAAALYRGGRAVVGAGAGLARGVGAAFGMGAVPAAGGGGSFAPFLLPTGGAAAAPPAGGAARGSRFSGPRFGILGTALAVGAGREMMADESFYKLYRERGDSKVGSAIRGTLTSLSETVGLGDLWQNMTGGPDRRTQLRSEKTRTLYDRPHRDVSPLRTELLDVGDSAQLIQEEVLKLADLKAPGAGGGGSDLAGSVKKLDDTIGALAKLIEQAKEEARQRELRSFTNLPPLDRWLKGERSG